MAEEQDPSGPSLEPPSLFRRKRKKADTPAPAVSEPQAEIPVETPVETPVEPTVEPTVVTPVDDSPTTILDATPTPTPTSVSPGPRPTAPPPPPLYVDEAPTETLVPQAPAAASAVTAPTTTPTTAPDAAPTPPRPPREGPLLPGRIAAAVAGALAGALIVGLTTAAFELCGQIQGTNSCGNPGILLLMAILALAVVLGTVVLRLCQVPEPGSTSFLAVGLTSVVALLFLVDALFEWWMVIVIPLVSVATFLLSHWVTTTFVEPATPGAVVNEPEVVDSDVR